jgi:hypothetical protein
MNMYVEELINNHSKPKYQLSIHEVYTLIENLQNNISKLNTDINMYQLLREVNVNAQSRNHQRARKFSK